MQPMEVTCIVLFSLSRFSPKAHGLICYGWCNTTVNRFLHLPLLLHRRECRYASSAAWKARNIFLGTNRKCSDLKYSTCLLQDGGGSHHSEDVKKKCFCFQMSAKITCAEALFQGNQLYLLQKLYKLSA